MSTMILGGDDWDNSIENVRILAEYGPLTTLKFSTNQVCAFCAKFYIMATLEIPSDDLLWFRVSCWHKIDIQYEDVYPRFPRMEERASKGCTFCKFLRTSLRSECFKRNLYAFNGEGKRVQIVLTASKCLGVQSGSAFSSFEKEAPHYIKVQVSPETYFEFSYEIIFQFLSRTTITRRNPLSTESIDDMLQWLQECDKNHPTCDAALTKYCPTRLLAVHTDNLHIETTAPKNVKYAALSYCWGKLYGKKGKSFLTKKSNVADRISGFKLSELPQTLSDAVLTARALDIDYVWIDAICIIQDDKEDWEREAATMGEVYRHAYVTIAAANSTSSTNGFLHHRDISCRASLQYSRTEILTSCPKNVMNHTGDIHFRYPPETTLTEHFSKCMWNQRAWTLQEKLLSTRTLFFTKDIIYYDCAASQRVEMPGYKLPKPLERLNLMLDPDNSERSTQIEIHQSSWYRLVRDYSIRELTSSGDILKALEGLVETFKHLMDDEYVYGLWKSDLHRGLLWATRGKSIQLTSRDRAPTWSWAHRYQAAMWDKATLKPGWKSLMSELEVSPAQKCSHCNHQTMRKLVFSAPMAPLKDYLETYDTNSHRPEDYDSDDEVDLVALNDLEQIGCFEVDDQEGLIGLRLRDVSILLTAERSEPENVQGILVRPTGDPDQFERISMFIYNRSHYVDSDEESGSDIGENYEGYFEPYWKDFKLGQVILV